MKHNYEVRKLENDGKVTTVKKFFAEPKEVKREAKAYAREHPGLYTLYRVETVEIYFTEKERKSKD